MGNEKGEVLPNRLLDGDMRHTSGKPIQIFGAATSPGLGVMVSFKTIFTHFSLGERFEINVL